MCGGAPPQHCVVELYPKLVGSSSIPTLELHPNIAGPTGPRSCGYFSSILTWKCSPTLWGETLPQLRGAGTPPRHGGLELHPSIVVRKHTPTLRGATPTQHCGNFTRLLAWKPSTLFGGAAPQPRLWGVTPPQHCWVEVHLVICGRALIQWNSTKLCGVEVHPNSVGCKSNPTRGATPPQHRGLGWKFHPTVRGGVWVYGYWCLCAKDFMTIVTSLLFPSEIL